MTIVFRTDFSENADTGARAAGSIAKRLALPLKLVHVTDLPGADDSVYEPLRAAFALTSVSCVCSVIVPDLVLALYTKLRGADCLRHVGREGCCSSDCR